MGSAITFYENHSHDSEEGPRKKIDWLVLIKRDDAPKLYSTHTHRDQLQHYKSHHSWSLNKVFLVTELEMDDLSQLLAADKTFKN